MKTQPVVLLAEDDLPTIHSMTRELVREGVRVVSDASSMRVLEFARAHRPAVIVLDIHQVIDGREILLALKADPQTKDIRVVMLSSVEDQDVRRICFELGAEDYLVKPCDPTVIRKIALLAGAELPSASF